MEGGGWACGKDVVHAGNGRGGGKHTAAVRCELGVLMVRRVAVALHPAYPSLLLEFARQARSLPRKHPRVACRGAALASLPPPSPALCLDASVPACRHAGLQRRQGLCGRLGVQDSGL